MISYLHFEQLHGKKNVGSTNLRVHQMIKYWPEAQEYKFGSKPDVLIFQKVYWNVDYYLPETYKGGLKILDICDPDWLDNMYVKRTIDNMDAVVVPSKGLQDFIQQLTDNPVKLIPDRFDMEFVPKLKKHKGKIKQAVWFGYRHNADVLEGAIRTLERMGIGLTIISDDDPLVWRFAQDSDKYRKNYKYYKYNEESIYTRLQEADICLLPDGIRPKDIFKSNNKTIKAQLAGLPVAKNIDDLERLMSDIERNKEAEYNYKQAKKAYDVKLSVKEYKELIEELSNGVYSRDKKN